MSDLEKARKLCDGAAFVFAIDPVNGLEALVESVAEALAAERASLPESVIVALRNYKEIIESDEEAAFAVKVIEQLKAWQQGARE